MINKPLAEAYKGGISMNPGTFLIAALLAAAIYGIVRYLRKQWKAGHGFCGDCASCGHCNGSCQGCSGCGNAAKQKNAQK